MDSSSLVLGRCAVLFFVALLTLLPAAAGSAQDAAPATTTSTTGQVSLPLEEYQRLLAQASTLPPAAPSAYAIGQSVLNLNFQQRDGHVAGTIEALVEIETFGDDWTLVELLGPGAALASATVNNQPVQLVQRTDGLFWLADKRQKASLKLIYHVDSRFADRAYITSVPIPRAAATRFTARIPQTHIDLAVAPVANLVTREGVGFTTATGTLPTSAAMILSWRVAAAQDYVLNRADYTGVVQQSEPAQGGESAIDWHAVIVAEMLRDGETSIPLVSTATTLISVEVDGKPATVLTEKDRFALRLAGAGKHRIDLRFLSPVSHPDGVPSSGFDIPSVPVSKFTLNLPGEKLVTATTQKGLGTSVELTHQKGQTVASFHLPMSDALHINWMAAIPAEVDVERRANAVVYQALHAAEGVLYGMASIRYEITRGEANALEFTLPAGAEVNQVSSAGGAIADWIVTGAEDGQERRTNDDTLVRVFLNRAVSGEFTLQVAYEQLLEDGANAGANTAPGAPIAAPILRALNVARQKGMVALLSGTDLALAPLAHPAMSEVGENQLPAFFRNQLQLAVSHTYKYHSADAQLTVNSVTPERRQGKFNTQIDSLISIGEVTLEGQVSIETDVKSGVLRALRLSLPVDVNLLGVNGPSIRNHILTMENNRQFVDIEFTREMDGQFRIELHYERIMLDGSAETNVPQIEVVDADVAHGRIAIEALSALEVQAAVVEHLSSLEISQLPRQLVLKTTNPILLAYRYVETETPFALQLRITRHEEIDVQVAAIDQANYQTLITADGLEVTRAQFEVRNSRQQFLRLSLPSDTEIWSVFVNGNAQKPAFAADPGPGSTDVLIKMINSATAFPVELVYASRGPAMDNFGSIESRLPRPDMIVTHSNWDVYVPVAPRYGKPSTNMDILAAEAISMVKNASIEALRGTVANVISGEPLHIELPTQGLLYRFGKLYANQSAEDAYISLRYVQRAANFAGLWISVLATLALWAGIVLLGWSHRGAVSGEADFAAQLAVPPTLPWILIATGATAIAGSIHWLGARVMPPSLLSLVIVIALLGWKVFRLWQNHREGGF